MKTSIILSLLAIPYTCSPIPVTVPVEGLSDLTISTGEGIQKNIRSSIQETEIPLQELQRDQHAVSIENRINRAILTESGVGPSGLIMGYRAIKLLGTGMHGRAYLVEDRSSGKKLVLKVIKGYDDHSLTPPVVINEYKIINHPAVNLGMGHFTTKNGYFFIPMKYIEGEVYEDYYFDLMKTEEGKKTINEIRIKIINEMTRLHEAGIVHLDIAPRNIIIDKKTHVPTFIDYGRAKFSKRYRDRSLDRVILDMEEARVISQNRPALEKSLVRE